MRPENKRRSTSGDNLIHLPPQNIEAEESLISAILVDNKVLLEVVCLLSSEYFYRTAHQKIFTAIIELHEKSQPIDLVTLSNCLREKEQLEIVGGAMYLARLIDTVPLATNAVHYAEIIRNNAAKRKGIERASAIANKCYEDSTSSEDVAAHFLEATTEVLLMAGKGDSAEKIEMSLVKIQKHYANAVEMPFGSLAEEIDMLMPGDLLVIGGESGMGKTSLSLKFLTHCAIDQKNARSVIYCGAQREKEIIFSRILAQRCKLPLRKKVMGGRQLSGKERELLLEQEQMINDAPIYKIILPSRISLPALQTQVLSAREKIGQTPLLIIENLQQIYWPGKNFRQDWEMASYVSGRLRDFTHQYSIPTTISSQLTRKMGDREDRRPQLIDLFGKDAGDLCDIALLLYRPDYHEKKRGEKGALEAGKPEKNAEIIIAKGGPSLILPFTFWGEYLLWEEN